MRVLVSGGNRYIGLELVRELAAAGHAVTVVNSHEVPLPAGVRRIHADRRLPGAFEAALGPHRDDFDAFFDNTAFVPADVLPMIELFRGRLAHYVFTSSQAVYRRSYVLPIQEGFRRHAADDEDPRKAYGVGKVRCEDLLLAEAAASGFPATCLRVGHTMGPRSPAPTRDPIFFARLESGRPIPVPGDGYAVTQLIHINDVARAMLSLLGNAAVTGKAYNVSGGEQASILGVIQLIGRATGLTPRVVHVPQELARRQRPPLLHWGEALTGSAYLDIGALHRATGWWPTYGIEAGYADAWTWYQEEGRHWYSFDFSTEDALLASLAAG
ncbi:MAG: NAD-dependent epimerase/dehydratase family protein [Pseudomonadales bacterium]|nr:NAD-dependent epimerase/dehydratase family protein [Pseudomonadales bacterium]MCP5185600.1 NAD-dependent epimerase/dehydratase family protein [Pseudomonadales bacterium]